MSNDDYFKIGLAVASGVVSASVTHWLHKHHYEDSVALMRRQAISLDAELARYKALYAENSDTLAAERQARAAAEQEVGRLKVVETRHDELIRKLSQTPFIETYHQPVVLLGPRSVGKTCLFDHISAPWEDVQVSQTFTHKEAMFPVHDFVGTATKPNFLYPDVSSPVHQHLLLKLHDFPGETDWQAEVLNRIEKETQILRAATGKALGVVLVAMFDASEAHGSISDATKKYYSGQLFSQMRALVVSRALSIQRLIIVFNKFDLLRSQYSEIQHNDLSLLNMCLKKFKPVYEEFENAVNADRWVELVSVLGGPDIHLRSRGGNVLIGEMSRDFVAAMAGPAEADRIFRHRATQDVQKLVAGSQSRFG